MAIPPEFNEVEHLQSVIRRYINKQVREDFRDLGGDDWEPDITTTRAAMRYALTHKDNDPLQVTLGRMFLYYFTYGKAKAMQPDIFGGTIITLDKQRKYKPQITLYFNNKGYDSEKKNELVEGEISFRIMDKESTTITQLDLETYARKIKSLFAIPKFIWRKGKTLVSYTDWDKGYQLQLLVTNTLEARRIVEQVLDIQNHTPDWKKLHTKTPEEPLATYPENPGTHRILGETVEKVKSRPREDVYFRYATINVHGKGRGITLVDTTSVRRNAIERVA